MVGSIYIYTVNKILAKSVIPMIMFLGLYKMARQTGKKTNIVTRYFINFDQLKFTKSEHLWKTLHISKKKTKTRLSHYKQQKEYFRNNVAPI